MAHRGKKTVPGFLVIHPARSTNHGKLIFNPESGDCLKLRLTPPTAWEIKPNLGVEKSGTTKRVKPVKRRKPLPGFGIQPLPFQRKENP